MRACSLRTGLACSLLALTACNQSVFQEVLDQGAGRYFGKAKISSQVAQGNVTTYNFDPASGPLCMRGDPYNVTVRDTGSEGLFIFLQGGGACWSDFCLAITVAEPGIPKLDVLDPDKATNPMAGWSTVYLPYCDGSLFVGDAESDDNNGGKINRFQHGLQNLSAALDVAVKRFPNPSRIVLAGSSGGGYGSILATTLVRSRYPKGDLLVFNDSGVGLGKPGDPAFINTLLTQFNASSIIPKSCKDCTGNGHVTRLIDWELAHDPALKIAAFSSYEDYVISQIYLKIDPAVFKSTLIAETGAVHAAYAGRYKRFLVNGAIHTTLLGGVTGLVGDNLNAVTLPPDFFNYLNNIKLGGIDTTVVGGMTIAQWFKAMLDGSDGWDDRLDP